MTKKRKEFENKLKDLGITKSAYNNIMLNVNKKINAHLKDNGIKSFYGIKMMSKIALFRKLINEEPYKLNNKYDAYYWLIDLWVNGKSEILKKEDPLNFYLSKEWRELREIVLNTYGMVCMKCGNKNNITVDHIKPKSLHPELALCFDNLQVLCLECNSSKSNRFEIDYRCKRELDNIAV